MESGQFSGHMPANVLPVWAAILFSSVMVQLIEAVTKSTWPIIAGFAREGEIQPSLSH